MLQLALEHQQAKVEVLSRSNHLNWRTLDLSRFDAEQLEGDTLAMIGMKLYRPEIKPVIGQVVAGSVAEQAGLQAGDRIVAANGKPVASWNELVQIRAQPSWRRTAAGAAAEKNDARLALVPETVQQDGSAVGRIGAAAQIDQQALDELVTVVRYGCGTALVKAAQKTWDTSRSA